MTLIYVLIRQFFFIGLLSLRSGETASASAASSVPQTPTTSVARTPSVSPSSPPSSEPSRAAASARKRMVAFTRPNRRSGTSVCTRLSRLIS